MDTNRLKAQNLPLYLEVPSKMDGWKVERILRSLLQDISPAQLEQTFHTGKVRGGSGKNKGKPLKPHFRLPAGHSLQVEPVTHLNLPKTGKAQILPKTLNDGVLAWNKPSGLPSQPNPKFPPGHSLLEQVQNLKKELNLELIHRLDASTSGLILTAPKGSKALSLGADILKSGQKFYLGLSPHHSDEPWPKEQIIDLDMIKARGSRGMKMEIAPSEVKQEKTLGSAKKSRLQKVFSAKTKVTLLQENDWGKLLLIQPFTGRTHQIRCHLAHVNSPLFGEKTYLNHQQKSLHQEAKRLYLHSLAFIHPELGKAYCPLPKKWLQTLADKGFDQGIIPEVDAL